MLGFCISSSSRHFLIWFISIPWPLEGTNFLRKYLGTYLWAWYPAYLLPTCRHIDTYILLVLRKSDDDWVNAMPGQQSIDLSNGRQDCNRCDWVKKKKTLHCTGNVSWTQTPGCLPVKSRAGGVSSTSGALRRVKTNSAVLRWKPQQKQIPWSWSRSRCCFLCIQINQLSTRPDEWMNACSFEQTQWGLRIQRFNNPLLVCPPRWLIPWIHHKCPWKHCNCWKGWGLRGLRRFYQGWEMNQITLRMFLTNPG